MGEDRMVRSTRWLLVALALAALINMAIIAGVMLAHGESLEESHDASGLLLSARITGRTGIDSWRPMAAAYTLDRLVPGSLYWLFLNQGVKFQYPPSALLVMPLLPLPISPEFRAKVAVPSYLAVFFTIFCSIWLALKRIAESSQSEIRWRDPLVACTALLIATLGWTYYPLTKGHSLGQIQVYLGALVALALLLNAYEFRGLSGACLGLCCLVKPQYGLLLVWGLLRREKRFVIGLVAVAALGLALSFKTFGLQNHMQYLEVLQRLSRFGEAYGPNQTVNGWLQRWLENGNPIKFQPKALPPYSPIVYYGTLVSSLALVGLAMFLPTPARLRGSAIDLAVAVAAATMASPIAWEHHYGAFFPIFAVALPVALAAGRSGLLLLVSYELMANESVRAKLIYLNRWTGLAGSHLFYGALLLFGLLLMARWRGNRASNNPVSHR